MKMTVGQLMEILSCFNEDDEVRLAMQPAWPMEYTIGDVEDVYLDNGETVVYIGEGEQTGYLPNDVTEALGWSN